jgi:hypothetical protein
MNFKQFLKFDEKFYDNVPVNGLDAAIYINPVKAT